MPEPPLQAAPPPKRSKPGRLARHAANARALWANPRSAPSVLRGALLGIWRSRGGGFYGLGYLVTFLLLEVRMLFRELAGSDGVLEFVGSQALEYLLRLSLLSLLNALQAFVWPLLMFAKLGPLSLLLLLAGYLAFERVLRPRLEVAFPELRKPAGVADPDSPP